MDDPKLKAKGKALMQHYGCAGCHEISGLEDEGRIGTELTNEGSKPIERLDFALFTEDAKRGILPDGKKSPRGSVVRPEGLLRDTSSPTRPSSITGKYKPNPMDRLRMPKPNVTQEDIDALTTMLLGSTDPSLPPDYMYKPADERAAIQKGWWIVTKYNCMGCHQIDIGQKSVLMGLPHVSGSRTRSNLPPGADQRRRARQSRMAEGFSGQSGAEHHGHQSQRRAQLSAGAHAHVLPVGR